MREIQTIITRVLLQFQSQAAQRQAQFPGRPCPITAASTQRFQNMLPRYFRERGGQKNIIQAGADVDDSANNFAPPGRAASAAMNQSRRSSRPTLERQRRVHSTDWVWGTKAVPINARKCNLSLKKCIELQPAGLYGFVRKRQHMLRQTRTALVRHKR